MLIIVAGGRSRVEGDAQRVVFLASQGSHKNGKNVNLDWSLLEVVPLAALSDVL